jgi:hypothetical protein
MSCFSCGRIGLYALPHYAASGDQLPATNRKLHIKKPAHTIERYDFQRPVWLEAGGS